METSSVIAGSFLLFPVRAMRTGRDVPARPRSPVGQSAAGVGDHGLQRVQVTDNDVAIADTPAAIVVFVVQVRVQGRPEGVGDLVGDRKSGVDAELLYLLDVVSVVGIMP
jgi:hypothetical protein